MPSPTPRLSLEEAKTCIEQDPAFMPFRDLLTNEALFKFIYHEKCCFTGDIPEDRVVWEIDPETGIAKDVGGYRVKTQKPSDAYSPDKFLAFPITGVWLPIEACHMFTTLDAFQECPLSSADRKKILFLIHPHSQSIYQGLLDDPSLQKANCFALSLSSFRSLLVAIPKTQGKFELAMVKVSLDQEIEGVRRLLSMRECKLSVANTLILRQKMQERAAAGQESLPISFVEDVLSYVPKGYEDVGGMLYRPLPACLRPTEEAKKIAVMPLLALYGVKNRDLFEKLVAESGLSLTEFLQNALLAPLAKLFVEMLLYHQTSIQAHGQNLSVVLQDNKIISFLSRDMGGVSQVITSPEQEKMLPEALQDYSAYSYIENHRKDAKKAFEEHFVQRALFPLTKQLCKTQQFLSDENFKRWFDFVEGSGLLANWTTTLPNSMDDEHTINLPSRQAFCRYGYVEGWFARMMINYLKMSGIASDAEAEEFDRHFSLPEQLDDGTMVPPCSNIRFFEAVVDFIVDKRPVLAATAESFSFRPRP